MQTIEREAHEVLDIKVGGTIITCTPEHPFWVEGQGWVEAGDLERGSRLVSKDGKEVCVETVSRREGRRKVYNIEVEQLHTYFVSNLALLVHNANCTMGFAKGTASTALTPDRLQHASRHLTEAGILPNGSNATKKKFIDLATNILENPMKTFDYVLKGGESVKGFVGEAGGQKVVIFVFKSGALSGKVATSVVPTAAQASKWNL